MLLLIIKTFQEQRNDIHFAYNEGVEIKWGGGGGGVEFFGKFVKCGGLKFSNKLQSYPPPPPPLQLSTTEYIIKLHKCDKRWHSYLNILMISIKRCFVEFWNEDLLHSGNSIFEIDGLVFYLIVVMHLVLWLSACILMLLFISLHK